MRYWGQGCKKILGGLDLAALGAHLSVLLANEPLKVQGHRIEIGHVDLSSLRLAELGLTLAGSALRLSGMATGNLAATAP